jgi:hypothetical protein
MGKIHKRFHLFGFFLRRWVLIMFDLSRMHEELPFDIHV